MRVVSVGGARAQFAAHFQKASVQLGAFRFTFCTGRQTKLKFPHARPTDLEEV
ncbi:hypothetical protein HMPREF3198_00529 [Winkia neuii]|nr:hypothetical protein HMPREF3198_00529 [Winkia neuii]